MSQDYTVDCFAGNHVVQTDMANIEKNFECLRTAFSGATAPSNPVAGMWWLDTTAHVLKKMNEANDAWFNVWDMANNKPVITNNVLADFNSALKSPAAGIEGFRKLGTGATDACAGNDSRLSDARVPVDASVAQGKLKTSFGEVSTNSATLITLDLPGGAYGFYPQFKVPSVSYVIAQLMYNHTPYPYSYETHVAMYSSNGVTNYCGQRYVTASGEVHWIFLLRDKKTKEITCMYQAPDHPCFGSGGKPLLKPHPFGNYDPKAQEIVVITPSQDIVGDIWDKQDVDDDGITDLGFLEVMQRDYMVDESSNPIWPIKPVTVKLLGDRDWKTAQAGEGVEVLKAVIPKPLYVHHKNLRLKV